MGITTLTTKKISCSYPIVPQSFNWCHSTHAFIIECFCHRVQLFPNTLLLEKILWLVTQGRQGRRRPTTLSIHKPKTHSHKANRTQARRFFHSLSSIIVIFCDVNERFFITPHQILPPYTTQPTHRTPLRPHLLCLLSFQIGIVLAPVISVDVKRSLGWHIAAATNEHGSSKQPPADRGAQRFNGAHETFFRRGSLTTTSHIEKESFLRRRRHHLAGDVVRRIFAIYTRSFAARV